MKKSMHRASLLTDALNELTEMEMAFADLPQCDVFQSFTSEEKAQYRDVITRLRDLIREVEDDSAQEQRAF